MSTLFALVVASALGAVPMYLFDSPNDMVVGFFVSTVGYFFAKYWFKNWMNE